MIRVGARPNVFRVLCCRVRSFFGKVRYRARSLKVRRIGKLWSEFKVWRYVPTHFETLYTWRYDAEANAYINTYPRAGFGFQVFRLAFQVTYDK